MRNTFTWTGLDGMASRWTRMASEIAYIALYDRTKDGKEDPVGRFDFAGRAPMPAESADASKNDEDDPTEEDGDEDVPDEVDSELASELRQAAMPSAQPTRPDMASPSDLANAAVEWLKDITYRNTIGESFRKFRFKVWAAKGARLVDSGMILCRNADHDLDLPAATPTTTAVAVRKETDELTIPMPKFDAEASTGVLKGVKALGDYYAQWGHIVLGSMHQLQAVNNGMLGKLHRQVEDSRTQVDNLVGAIIDYRTNALNAAEQRKAETQASDSRTELAKQAIAQIGDAAKAFLVGRGIPPELSEVLAQIGNSPDLMATLNDPAVRELMKEPGNLDMVAGMLRHAAQAAQATREATPPRDPETEG